MQRLLSKYLAIVVIVTLLPVLLVTGYFYMTNARQEALESGYIKINQIESIVQQNNENMEALQSDLAEEYLTRAKAAAYILQHHPDYIYDVKELNRIAELLQVDEIHIFNKEGVLYTGNIPKYFGFRIDAGEQVSFFAPMLEDYSLELVQEITPNSAEAKPMQYVAVWQENKENIVQIGLVPERVMKEMEKNELDYVLSMVTPDKGSVIFVIDKKTEHIIGATNETIKNMHMDEVGIMSDALHPEDGFWTNINGIESLCVYEPFDEYYIGVAKPRNLVYENIVMNVAIVAFCLLLLGIVAVIAIRKCIDKVIIHDIQRVNEQLNSITVGKLDTEVHIDTTPEMHDLTHNIGIMVQSLLNNNRYMSYIFEMTGTEAGVYTYSDASSQVHVTDKVGRLLMLSEEELQRITVDKTLFIEKIEEIKNNKLPKLLDNKEVYCLKGLQQNQDYYLQIQTVDEAPNHFGLITDRTVLVREREQLERERDYDLLTSLLNRRGFYQQFHVFLDDVPDTKCGVFLMLDMDHLKYINDTFGHAGGDAVLCAAAKLLLDFVKDEGIAARLSGDEFVVFLYAENQDILRNRIDALHRIYTETEVVMSNHSKVPLRFSGGYVFVNAQNKNRQLLIKKADKALYRAKNNGRGILLEYQLALDGPVEE